MRHNFFWGERFGFQHVLNVLEGLALVLFVCLAGVAYVRARTEELSARVILQGGCVLTLVALLAPPFLSSDIFDNIARGRVESVHGANPYLVAPAAFPDDPLMANAQYRDSPMPYGPVSAVLQTGITGASGDHLWPTVYGFKLAFALCHIGTAWLLYLALCRRNQAQAGRALFLYLWNPWILMETAGSGHNDALMALFLAFMIWLLSEGRWAWATLAFGTAALTKHGCVVIGPFLLVLAIRQGKLRAFGLGALATLLLTALFVWHYFPVPQALEALWLQTAVGQTSLQHFLTLWLGEGSERALLLCGYSITLLYLGATLRKIEDLESFGRQSSRLIMVFLVAAMAQASPWYHLWWLPMLGLWGLSDCVSVLRLLAFLGPLSYLVYATTRSYALDHQIWQWSLALAIPAFWMLGPKRGSSRPVGP